MTKVKHIKVPEGCIRRANELGILPSLKRYYALKTVFVSGYFRNGEMIRVAAQRLSVSERTIKRWLDALVDLSFAYRDKYGIGLRKYDLVFCLLGYDMQEKTTKSGHRLGRFKIHKISSGRVVDFVSEVAKEEVALNMSRQEYMIRKKSTQKKQSGSIVDVNTDVSLSCFGVAKLLGYKSKSSGHRIETAMSSSNFLIDRRFSVTDATPIIEYNMSAAQYLYRGMLCTTETNKFHIN